jgi:ArsR family transcriptional regulator
MNLTPEPFARALSDPTRMRILLLLLGHQELCVCELTEALELPQPKISRHLAILRETGLLLDRRAGQWIHYRLHPELPDWSLTALQAIDQGSRDTQPYAADHRRLADLRSCAADNCVRLD